MNKKIELMRKACLCCDKSNCEVKTGCIVVKDGKIILESNNYIPADAVNGGMSEREYAVHAEEAAIKQANKKGVDLNGSQIYLSRFPCENCSEKIVALGISKIYYMSDLFTHGNTAEPKLRNSGIKIEQIPESEVWAE